MVILKKIHFIIKAKSNNMYKKDEKKIVFTDIEDSLALVISSFSTITSYENQTKKSITNKFIRSYH